MRHTNRQKNINISAFLKAIIIVMAFFLLTSFSISPAAKEGEYEESSLCEILAKSNMRDKASKEGRIVGKIPEGAVVVVVSDNGADFVKVKYGGEEGFIFRGCMSTKRSHTIDEYNKQFDETLHIKGASVDNKRPDKVVIVSSGNGALNQSESAVQSSDTGVTTKEESTIKKISDEVTIKTSPDAIFLGSGGSSNNVSDTSVVSYKTTGKVTTDLRLREGPSTSTAKLTTIPRGSVINVIDEGVDGFYHVEYNGKKGYAYSSCVKCDEAPAMAGASDNTMVSSGKSGMSFLSAGVRRKNSTEKESSSNPVEIKEVASGSQTSRLSQNVSYEITQRANMRSLPTKESDKLVTVPEGAEVIALGRTKDGYTLVQYNGLQGYVLENLVSTGTDIKLNRDTAVLFTITAYCPCQKCCGKFSPEVTGAAEPHTSTGVVPMQGRTVAVDPSVIPYGTHIVIEGLGSFVAEDCGGSVDGTHIDVYFDNHEDAKAFGVRRLYVSLE